MKCSRCGRLIEGSEIRFAREGDYSASGKPLCKTCRFQIEKESRNAYRKGMAKYPGDPYEKDVY